MTLRRSATNGPESEQRRDAIPVTLLIRRAIGMPDRASDEAVAEIQGKRFTKTSVRVESGRASLIRIALILVAIAFVPAIAAVGWRWVPGGPVVAVQASAPVQPARTAPESFGLGIPSLQDASADRVLDRFLASDFGEGSSPFFEQLVACGAVPWRNMPVLACVPGEPLGTRHNLVLSACQPQWVTPDAANAELRLQFADGPGTSRRLRTGENYSAAISWAESPGRSLVLSVTSDGVISYGANCDAAVKAVARH